MTGLEEEFCKWCIVGNIYSVVCSFAWKPPKQCSAEHLKRNQVEGAASSAASSGSKMRDSKWEY